MAIWVRSGCRLVESGRVLVLQLGRVDRSSGHGSVGLDRSLGVPLLDLVSGSGAKSGGTSCHLEAVVWSLGSTQRQCGMLESRGGLGSSATVNWAHGCGTTGESLQGHWVELLRLE